MSPSNVGYPIMTSVLLSLLFLGPVNADLLAVADDENKQLIERLQTVDFESLLDIPLALNPDWKVDTPTRIAQKLSRSPASVMVISKEQIRWFGYTSVAQILRHIAGFSATDDLLQSSFGVRGNHPGARGGNRNFTVMLDDQPVGFSANDHHFIDRNLIPMSLIERIEVVKGPVSALYGANAFLAVVNIVSKSAGEFVRKGDLLYLEAESVGAAGNGWFAELAGGHKAGGWDSSYGVALGYADRGGLSLPLSSPDYEKILDGRDLQQISRNNDSKPLSLYAKTRRHFSDGAYSGVSLHYQQLQSDHVYGDLNPLQSHGNSEVGLYNGFLRVDHYQPLNETWSVKMALSIKKGAPLSGDRVELGSEHFYYQRDFGYRRLNGSLALSWQSATLGDWLLGTEHFSDDHELESFSRVEKDTEIVTRLSDPQTKKYHNQSYYLQWLSQWPLGFDTIVGYRRDANRLYASQNSFRFGMIYPLGESHSLKLLYGSSFQAPSVELLYRRPIQSGDLIGNPDLAPQRAKTLELVGAGSLGDNIRYSATLYHSNVNELVVYRDELSNLAAVNGASADTFGLELEVSYDSDALHAYFNAGWQDISLEDDSLFVLENRPQGELFPQYTANLGISYRWLNDVRLSLDNQFHGKRPASSSNVLAAERFYQLDSYFDSTLTLQRSINWLTLGGSVIKFQVQDLWDARHSNPGFGGIDIPGLGRRYSLSFSQRF